MNASVDHAPVRQTHHLSGFRFRQTAPAGVPAPARPDLGTEWPLDFTIGELRRRNTTLLATDHGVRLVTPRRPPRALALAVERHGTALLLALQLGVLDCSVPAPWAAPEWDDPTRLHAAWFGLRFSPHAPYAIAAGVRVVDHEAMRSHVAAALDAGPASPGASTMRRTLASLYSKYGPNSAARLRVVPPPRALAA